MLTKDDGDCLIVVDVDTVLRHVGPLEILQVIERGQREGDGAEYGLLRLCSVHNFSLPMVGCWLMSQAFRRAPQSYP